MPRVWIGLLSTIAFTSVAFGQSTQPSTARAVDQPTTRPAARSAEETLKQMLQPQSHGAEPIQPLPDTTPSVDATSGESAVAPGAATQPLAREGSLLFDRIGRLSRSADGKDFEFTLDSDGKTLTDPPLVLIPNRKLMQLEDRVKTSYRDLKIQVSGEVTEYRGRNYLLLQRWSVVPDSVHPLQQ